MTQSPERNFKMTSFCCCCGKPVRWEVAVNDKRRNDEFCPDCQPYAAKVCRLEMEIEKYETEVIADRTNIGKSTDFAVKLQIEQLIKDRDVNIRILDTIRIGFEAECERITEQGMLYRIAKVSAN